MFIRKSHFYPLHLVNMLDSPFVAGHDAHPHPKGTGGLLGDVGAKAILPPCNPSELPHARPQQLKDSFWSTFHP